MLFTGRGRFVLGETVLGKILQQVFVFVFVVVCFVCFVFLCEKKIGKLRGKGVMQFSNGASRIPQGQLNHFQSCQTRSVKVNKQVCINTLSCGLIEHFNISGGEFVGSCIKLTGKTRCRVPRGKMVGVATVGVGIAVACSVVGYMQVVSTTKGWSLA